MSRLKFVLSLACVAALGLPRICLAVEAPPLVYTNPEPVFSTADGGLRPVVGVHNIQVFRANRTASTHADGLNPTYAHQPMLAWWKGKFYLEFLTNPVGEHEGAGSTSLTTSADGLHWENPREIFPPFLLPDGKPTLSHQRMGFHVAPDGRLLALAFYGKPPSPNEGNGIGRAIREIHEDGKFGPIYFIKFNTKGIIPGFTPPYPLYTASSDRGFVSACEALLANKLVTAQWWEEDALDESDFYRIKGKALSYITRPDGAVLGIWKNALVSLTRDGGKTWNDKQFATNLPNNASKYALQRTGDGRFALFLNPTNRLRFPLAVLTSDDCVNFSNLLTVHGELPDQRFDGNFKNLGPQYVRVITEGDGTPPDSANTSWIAYSVNKEDIWVSHIPLPIAGTVTDKSIHDDFNNAEPGSLPNGWNIYSPLWAPVRIVEAGGDAHHALELRDEDPYDYARAIRVFPETHGAKISFKILARQTNARLEIELTDRHGNRPFLIALGEDGHLWACHEGVWTDNGAYNAGQWFSFAINRPVKSTSDRCTLLINGLPAKPREIGPTEAADTIERLSFRTGPQRLRAFGGHDLPGADTKTPTAAFLIDDVDITPER